MRRERSILLLPLVLALAACAGGQGPGSPSAAAGGPAGSPTSEVMGEGPSASAGEQVTVELVPADGSDVRGSIVMTEYGASTNVQATVEGGTEEELWLEIRVGGCSDAVFQAMAARVPVQSGTANVDLPFPFPAMVQLPHSAVVLTGETEGEIRACADLGTEAASPSPSPS